MIYLKTDDEIELLRKANLLVSATLTEIAKICLLYTSDAADDSVYV